MEINAVKKEMNFLVTNDTTVYFPFERLVQNVYFKFVHDGQVVYPTIQYLEVFNSDSSEVRESQGILISKTGNIGDKTFNMFPDSMNLENGTYDLVYTMKDFYYNGTFNWGFDIENARGTDTTIYVVIPTKRNVELIITDALGEYVENVYGNIQKWDESGEHLINSFEFDASKHERLLSNQNGVVLDHLLPGKYQLKILDIVKNFEAATGVKVPYVIGARRPGDIATCYSSADKAYKELGWKAMYDIKEMCEDSWRWQKNNPNGYED